MNQLKLVRILILLILVIQFKKTHCNTKISEIENKVTTDHDKYITPLAFNKLASKDFNVRLAQANLASNMILSIQ